ncbi:cytochrome P450 [Microbispora sp. NEAU-D428]|uniref:cytochrome P450 family protein n=1 Tax=Microbispora sitophila TaxID=2771537 RepID=UPI001867756B|nr:cytochrome P450 [Microbispora sitophila]MBE3014802.1 cytochrome P450 [Microbispora sitophila]
MSAEQPSPTLYTPEFFRDPYPTLEWFRDHAPVAQFQFPVGDVPVWLVTRYEDVRFVLGDPRFSANPAHANSEIQASGILYSSLPPGMGQADPPDHARLRKPVMAVFTARRIQAWSQVAHDVVRSLLEGFRNRSEIDLVPEYAHVLPAEIIGRILGFQPDDRCQAAEDVRILFSGHPDKIPAAIKSLIELSEDLIATKRAHPDDDLVTHLVQMRDDGGGLDEAELIGTVTNLILGGYDTTQNLIGNAVLALLDHPVQRRLLQDQPSLHTAAVEEFLRYEGALLATWRYATEPVAVGGVELPAGAAILPLTLSANRDPRRFPNPDVLDITRSDVKHVGFGHGLHNCVGAALARLETEIAVPAIMSEFPDLRLGVAREKVCYRDSFYMRGLVELPVELR